MPTSSANTPLLGHRAERASRKVLPRLQTRLAPSELVVAYFLTNSLRPLMDFVAVTNLRVLGGHSSNVRGAPPLVDVHAADVAGIRIEKSAVLRQARFHAELRRGGSVFLGQILDEADEQPLRECLEGLAAPAPHTVAVPAPARAASRPPDVAPGREPGPTDWESMIGRLAEAGVLDQQQAGYVRSVLLESAEQPRDISGASPRMAFGLGPRPTT